MTRMTGPDCVVMCNLINTYIHTYIHTYINTYIHTYIHSDNLGSYKEAGGGAQGSRAQVRFVQVERVCPLCRV